MANDTMPNYNNCDDISDFCDPKYTLYGGKLSMPASAVFTLIFGVCFLLQIFFGIRARTWSFMIWIGIGTGFECLGYIARGIMSKNPWHKNALMVQYLTILLGPTFIAAALSVTFKHLVLWYGRQWSWIKPRLYPWIFVGTDFISIFIQFVGGGISVGNTTGDKFDQKKQDLAEALLITGVVFQVVNMIICALLMAIYTLRRKRAVKNGGFTPVDGAPLMGSAHSPSRDTATPQEAKKVRIFVGALAVAYIAIIIRCGYRVPEMIPKWSEDITKNQTLFYIFDSSLIAIAMIMATIFHPFNWFPHMNLKANRKAKVYDGGSGYNVPMNAYNNGAAPPTYNSSYPQQPPVQQQPTAPYVGTGYNGQVPPPADPRYESYRMA